MNLLYSCNSPHGKVEVFDLPCHIGIAIQETNSARIYRAWPKTDPEALKILEAIGKKDALVSSAA